MVWAIWPPPRMIRFKYYISLIGWGVGACVAYNTYNTYTGDGKESLVEIPSRKWHLKIRKSSWSLEEVHCLRFPIIILFDIDFVLIILPFKTNTKTSLETNFQTRPRPRHVLKQNFKQDQYQDWSWFENSVKTETNTWSWQPMSWISRPRPRVLLNTLVQQDHYLRPGPRLVLNL